MARRVDNDPILEAYHLWIDNGWEDSADGLAAVTSIMRVNQVLAKRADEILSPIELTFSRYEVLVRLHFNDGALPLAHLGKLLQVHQTSVTSLVDRLEAQGLIKRTPHPTDRRSTIAQITPTGRTQLQKAIKRLNSELFRDLGLTGEEVQTLIALLTKLRRSWSDVERCLTHEGNTEAGSERAAHEHGNEHGRGHDAQRHEQAAPASLGGRGPGYRHEDSG